MLGTLFERFVEQSPVSVMVEGVLRHTLPTTLLDDLFTRTAQRQYTHELLFSSLVDLMGQVVCGVHKSVCSAYQAGVADIAVSLTALYNKLNGVETQVSAELVRQPSATLASVVEHLGAALPDWVKGYRTRILDGNHRSGLEFESRVCRAELVNG